MIGTVIGLERERKHRPAGMRTHVLVCLGACIIAMIETEMEARIVALDNDHINLSMGRVIAQVVSGIGFLGAGTIFMSQKRVSGLTTAASLWNAACLGLAAVFVRLFKAGAKRWLLPVRNKPWNIRLPQFLRAACVSEHTQPSRIAHFILCRKFAYAAIKIPHADFSRRIARDNPMCYNTCESGLNINAANPRAKYQIDLSGG